MKIDENQKVTLTLGQLKRLVNESTESNEDDLSEYKTYSDLYRPMLRRHTRRYLYPGSTGFVETSSANLIYDSRKNPPVDFKWKPKDGYFGYPAIVTFQSELEAKKYIEKYLEANPDPELKELWDEIGVIYKVRKPFCNRPHKEIDTPYGKCLIPATEKVDYPGLYWKTS